MTRAIVAPFGLRLAAFGGRSRRRFARHGLQRACGRRCRLRRPADAAAIRRSPCRSRRSPCGRGGRCRRSSGGRPGRQTSIISGSAGFSSGFGFGRLGSAGGFDAAPPARPARPPRRPASRAQPRWRRLGSAGAAVGSGAASATGAMPASTGVSGGAVSAGALQRRRFSGATRPARLRRGASAGALGDRRRRSAGFGRFSMR